MNRIAKHIKKDIKDEKMANKGYKALAKKVNKTSAKVLLHIAKEEAQHKGMLLKLAKKADKIGKK